MPSGPASAATWTTGLDFFVVHADDSMMFVQFAGGHWHASVTYFGDFEHTEQSRGAAQEWAEQTLATLRSLSADRKPAAAGS